MPLTLTVARCTSVPGPNFVSMAPEVPTGVPWWLAVAVTAAAVATAAAAGREGGDDS